MAFSCEPLRTSAYSEDLRWRMVWQRYALGYTFKTIGTNLDVDPSTVQRTVNLFEVTGSVQKRQYSQVSIQKKITPSVEVIIYTLVVQQPGILLRELQSELRDYGVEVGLSTICQFLHRSGFSRQKMVLIAKQRDEHLRAVFAMDVSLYSPEMFVFLDETGADRRNTIRKYGYSIRGKPARCHKLLARGKRISAIALISVKGLLDCKVIHGTVDGDEFYDFVHSHLIAQLQPFNGSNPHSVVILDNASIHHVDEAVTAIEDTGAIVHFLPPYSPDLNPIEETFSKVKSTMQSLEDTMIEVDDIETIALTAFTMIDEQDCRNWIGKSTIYGQPE